MFRCRLFSGQYLLLTREYRDDRLDQVVGSHGLGKTFAGGDRSRLLQGRATSVRGGQKCRYRVAHSPAMSWTMSSPVVMCDGSFEGRRFESCHSLRAV